MNIYFNKIKSIYNRLRFFFYPGARVYDIEPYAFIRVKNEMPSLKASLESISFLKHGVIVYNECIDGSEQVIKAFCEKHHGFKAYKYPYKIRPLNKANWQKPETRKELYEYYNFALSKIPKNAWLLKIDADQIYLKEETLKSFKLVKYQNDVVCYPRINLHVLDREVLVDKHVAIRDVMDHWLIFNANLSFKPYIENDKVMEILHIARPVRWLKTSINSYHFPLLKKHRFTNNRKLFFTIDEFKSIYQKNPSKLIDGRRKNYNELLDLSILDNDRLKDVVSKLDLKKL